MTDERLEDLLTRLETERREADALYNDALTALDHTLQRAPDVPPTPKPYDDAKLGAANKVWNILPSGPPKVDGSLKGRLRGFVWRLVGRPLETQKHFNAALIDHLNRNVAAHREAEGATAALLEVVRQQLEGLVRFEEHLLRYLQTITLYVDTKDRAIAGQAQTLNAGLNALADDWLKRWETLAARDQRFLGRLTAIDDVRATAVTAQQAAFALKREVEKILAGAPTDVAAGLQPGGSSGGLKPAAYESGTTPGAPTTDLDSFKYLGFEDAFRGSPTKIRARLTDYVRRFGGLTDVLDVGCGRGEFLDLLREHGIPARGLDLNRAMVETSRSRGLDVVQADALTYVAALPDASLGGIFSAQVVEHLEPPYLMRLLETAAAKVRPGGLIVLETINPACWSAYFESYIRDLTHVRALHPETLQYLVRASGFHDVEIEFRSPMADWERLQPLSAPAETNLGVTDLVETFNANVEKLNARMFTFQDYAAIGRR